MAKKDMGSTPGLPGTGPNGSEENATTPSESISQPGKTPGPPSTNPFSQGRTGTTGGTGGVNPSGPTTGTEGWGLAPNENRTTGTSQGRMGASADEAPKPDRSISIDQGTGAPAGPQNVGTRSINAASRNPTQRGKNAEAKVTGTERELIPGAHTLGRTERDDVPVGERTFRCADAGNADCRWETSARTEEELMDSIERHGREAHGITNFDESARRKVIDAIRERRPFPFSVTNKGGMMVNPQDPNLGSTGNMSFRCSEINPNCSWEARGRDEQDLRRQIEQHGREHHNMRELSEDVWNRIRNSFRRSAA